MSIYKGSDKIVSIYKGSDKIIRAYKGTDLIFNPSQTELPDGYTKLQFLQTDGLAFIDTNYIGTQDTEISITLSVNSYANDNTVLFGDVSDISQSIALRLSSLDSRFGNQIKDSIYTLDNLISNIKKTVRVNATGFYLDNDNIAPINETLNFTTQGTLWLGRVNGSSVTGTECKIYQVVIKENNIIKLNLIPCVNHSLEYGMYDTVGKRFFTNANSFGGFSGEFEFQANGLPDNYIELDYIQLNDQAYMDLGIKGNLDITFDMEFQKLNHKQALGINTNAGDYFGANIDGTFDIGSRMQFTRVDAFERQTVRYRRTLSTQVAILTVNEQHIATKFETSNNDLSFILGGLPNSDDKYWCDGLKIYRSVNYIPCINPLGCYGLYDIINNKFIGNCNTVGLITGKFSLPTGYTRYDYITSSNNAYINLDYVANNNTDLVIDFEKHNSSVIQMWCGARASVNSKDSFYIAENNHTLYFNRYNATNMVNTTLSERDRIRLAPIAGYINDNKITSFNNRITKANNEIYLFTVNTDGVPDYRYWTGKIYSVLIRENGSVIKHLFPCIDPQSEVGLYDVINDRFYANAGQGYLLAGNENR